MSAHRPAPARAAWPDWLPDRDAVRRYWPGVVGGLLTLAMVASIGRHLLDAGLTGLVRALPSHPAFYLAFALLYVAPPLADFVVFRRLWNLPVEGLGALFRKRIANEVVAGYSGDAYFYAWAKQRSAMVAAPFGAVKDVMILSAVSGNLVTIALAMFALPLAAHLLPAQQVNALAVGMAVVAGLTLPYFLFKRVFSLPRADLLFIFKIHLARQAACALLLAMAWHYALPTVALEHWLVLATMRLMISRVPFVPNKDLLFANAALLLVGGTTELTSVLALAATLALAIHVVLIAWFGAQSLQHLWRPRLPRIAAILCAVRPPAERSAA